jgi:D-amino-acid oxidase
MDRRSFVRSGSVLAASSFLAGCSRRARVAMDPAAMIPVNLPVSSCHLPPVRVSEDRVTRTVVGLRPHRASGFRVEREQVGDTAVVHNYGHSGGGITLSWGTSKLAVDMGLPGYTGRVAVLGAGVIGLTTARLAQDAGYDVTIYTKALPPDTTSNIAGGQWAPSTVYDDPHKVSETFTDQYIFACKYAYERFQILTQPKYGVRWMRNFLIDRQPFSANFSQRSSFPREPAANAPRIAHATEKLMPEQKILNKRENPFRGFYTAQFDGMIIEPPMFLDALTEDFRIAGGRFVLGELKTPAEVQALQEKLVFNCTGLGAKALFGDDELTPIRGQLTFLLPQPEVTYATEFEDTYMFSRRDGVLLGGTFDWNNWSLEVDEKTVQEKLAKQKELFASLKEC